jgi:hypothetical protein
MKMINSYLSILRTPEVPSHRVVRKTAALCLLLNVALIYYRHQTLGFYNAESALMTFALAFLLFGVIGIFGGLVAAAFYDAFLKDVGATKQNNSLATFFAEWLFASSAPILGAIAFGALNSRAQ